MKKKVVIGGISVTIILFWIVGFWIWKENKKIKENSQSIQENIKTIDNEKNGDMKQQVILDDQLVWYEVPELGIRFKVTPDTKEDLGYSFRKNQTHDGSSIIKTAMFYSKTETDEKLTGCELSEDTGHSCGVFQLSSKIEKEDNDTKLDYQNCERIGGYIFVGNATNKICSFGEPSRGEGTTSDSVYKNFFHLSGKVESKNYGIYLNTIELIAE
jgi:hypothetical protein